MNDFEAKQSIRQIMLFHRGRVNAIKRRDFCELLGWKFNSTNDRRLREFITEIRRGDSMNEPFPILSCPNGYYLPATREEKEAGIKYFNSYIKDACITLRALKQGGERYLIGDKQEAML
jgi:hypothetical protein